MSISMKSNFQEFRDDFVRRRKGALSFPITGIINYGAAALLSLFVAPPQHNLVLTICFWLIMPIGYFIGKVRGEDFAGNSDNPLFSLGKLARVMVLLTWFIHVPVWIYAPDLFPLTVGIAFGLHWIVFGWSLGHPVGIVHASMRCVLVAAAWMLFPDNRMGAVAAAVSFAYVVSLWQLSQIDWQSGDAH